MAARGPSVPLLDALLGSGLPGSGSLLCYGLSRSLGGLLLGLLGGLSLELSGTLGLLGSLGLALGGTTGGLLLGLLGALGLLGSLALEGGLSGATELISEALNASAGIDELLLTGVERMALVAELDANLGDGGTGHEGVAAGATHRALHVLGMDSRFHAGSPYTRVLVSDQNV